MNKYKVGRDETDTLITIEADGIQIEDGCLCFYRNKIVIENDKEYTYRELYGAISPEGWTVVTKVEK